MGRRSALMVVGALVFGVAACGGGGGGGDEDAFCDSLEALSGLVEDGDLGDDDGLGDAVDIANDLREAASDDQEDAVQEVGQTLAEADPDDAADTAETVQDELGDFADDCEIDDFAVAPEVTTTTTEPEETTTTTEVEDTTTTSDGGGGGGGGGDLNVVTAAIDPSGLSIEPGFEQLVLDCFDGLMRACDDIFFGSEDGSVAPAPQGSDTSAFGSSCGGRIEFNNDTVRCVDNLFAASEFDPATFTDPSFEGLATACKGDIDAGIAGDMQSCDDLFLQTPVGSIEELYGDTCGGRIDENVADRQDTCVAIFGPTAQFG